MNNFANAYHVLTKLGIKMYFYTSILCTNFQGNQVTPFHFMVTFMLWRKEDEKHEKMKNYANFESQKRLV